LLVRTRGVSKHAFAMLLATLVLLGAGAALGLALTAGAAPLGALDDTTTPTPTQPTPDPAPPAPKPKPASKPAPKRTYTPPKSTYTAPTRTYSAPSYTPTPSSVKPQSTTPRVTHKVRKHKVRKHKKAVVTTPTETSPAPASAIPPAIPVRQVTRSGNAAVASTLFIAGVTFAALLFLLAAAVPGTSARFTPVGRVVIEHQQELVLVGVGSFVITLFVYVITGHGL
jgi:hypothetical protein